MSNLFCPYPFFDNILESRYSDYCLSLYTKPVRRPSRKLKPYTIVFKDFFSNFSLGTMVVQPKKQNKKKKPNCKPIPPAITKELFNLFEQKSQDFFILPRTSQNEKYYPLLQNILNCITYQQDFLNSWSENFYIPFSVHYSDEFRQTLISFVKENLRIKSVLRKFLQFWRLKCLKQVNSEDIVTMEVPTEPIYIIDWKLRQKYVYEKNTLLQDITTKLFHHDGFFDRSIHPRNLLSNLPLTTSQMISVWNQLQPIPQKYLIVSLFQVYGFNMFYFKTDQKILLRLHALNKTMHQNCFFAKERLLDFIELAYQLEHVLCLYHKYSKLLNEQPEHLHLQRWRALCIRYYEAEIRFENDYERKRNIHNKIWDLCIPLMNEQQEVFS